jgi:hypothetical protein
MLDDQDIAHLPRVTPTQIEAKRSMPVESGEQVELAGIPFDVTQSSDGVLEGY